MEFSFKTTQNDLQECRIRNKHDMGNELSKLSKTLQQFVF